MLENSYDATGIRFGIAISSDLPRYSDMINSYDTDLVFETLDKIMSDIYEIRFVDFSQVDGLKIREVLDVTKPVQARNAFIFVVYNSVEHLAIGKVSGQQITCNLYVRQNIIFNNIEDKETTIDKKIEKYIIENYDNSDEETKRWMRCFLQRYRYGTQEKTNEFIKQKINRK